MGAARKGVVAVIGFSNAPSPLEPAWPSTHRALLPVAGKALIVTLIEQLASSGIRHLRIAGSIQQYAVRQRLGDGSEWGVTVRYSDLHGPDLRLQTLLEHGELLYLCGDNLHIGNFARLAPAGGAIVDDPIERCELPSYWTLTCGAPVRYSIRSATGRPYRRDPLLAAHSYHAANLSVASGGAEGLRMPGYPVAPEVFVDWDTHVADDATLGERIVIGKHCRVDRRVVLESGCVIGNGSIVGRDAHLRDVVVLPNTFVGAGVRLRDAVVSPLGLFDLDGAFIPSPSPSLVGRARTNAERRTGIPSEKRSVIERARQRRWRDRRQHACASADTQTRRDK